jgi:hypothetical protein
MALELEDMYQHEVQMMITVEMDAEEIDELIFGTETVMLAGCDRGYWRTMITAAWASAVRCGGR